MHHTNSHDDQGAGFRVKRTIGGSNAISLNDNVPLLTATANDYGYENIYTEERIQDIPKYEASRIPEKSKDLEDYD
mgnify:CR=1 FL=1